MDILQYIKDIFVALKAELIRHRGLAALLFASVFAAVLFLSVKWPKHYVSHAAVVMDVTNVIAPLVRGAADAGSANQNEKVQDVMTSRRILEQVLNRIEPNMEQLEPQEVEMRIADFRAGLMITTLDRRNITQVSYRAPTADQAYDTLAALVEIFIEDRMAARTRDSKDAHSFLSDRVVRYKRLLEEAEERLTQFKARNVDANEATVRGRINDLTSEIQNLKLSINETEERIRITRTQLAEESRYLESRQKMLALEERRLALNSQIDQLRLLYQDNYPDIVSLKAQVDEIDWAIAKIRSERGWESMQMSELPLFEELRKQLSTAEVSVQTQKRRLTALTNLLQQEYAMADKVSAVQAELTDLTRDYNVTKKVYEDMLARRENANLSLALQEEGQGETYRLIEPPTYPLKPAGIPAFFIYLSAPFLALAAPVGLALAYIIVDPRIRSYTVLSQKLPENVHLLGYVPHRGSPLGRRLLRKDMLMLVTLAIILMALYVYAFINYGPQLLF